MTSYDELIEFLLARFAEDEAVAKAATRGPWSLDDTGVVEEIRSDANNWVIAGSQRWRDGVWDFTFENPEDAVHAARWDPDRVLAECGAKRRIIRSMDVNAGRVVVRRQMITREMRDYILQLMAAPYADHPDYREEWKP